MHLKRFTVVQKMKKNSIIVLLIVYILNMYDGWAVSGAKRCIVNTVLIILLTLLLNEIDKKIRLNRKILLTVRLYRSNI